MKILKYIFGGALVLMMLIVVVGFFLPSTYELKESIVINVPAEIVFNEVNSFKNWNNWSPWQDKDPNAIISYEGPDAGVGSSMLWYSNDAKVGKGSQEIIASIPNKHIKTALKMVGWDTVSNATWDFSEEELNRTKVTWTFNTHVGKNIFYKYMVMMFKPALRKDYSKGLQQLKAHLEQK
jgi:hypothetical protein